MRINILCNQVFDGWKPTDVRLGGTEESVVRWAELLYKKGHTVRVYQNGFVGSYKQVVYLPREDYVGGGDICINIKSSEVAPKEPTLYLTNETNADTLDLSKYLGVIWPSQWAVDNIPVNNKTFVVPHGYDDTQIYPDKKMPKQCLYASSPDRGLNVLLEAWPRVYEAHPDATLVVTYGATDQNLPGVIFLGETDEETMNQLYRTSDIWCHPCTGGELFGITGIKAQAAGCVPVYRPIMALQETVRHGFRIHTPEDTAERLIFALDNPEVREEYRRHLAGERFVNWRDSTEELLKVVKLVLESQDK